MRRITTIKCSGMGTLDVIITMPRDMNKMPFKVKGIAVDHNTGVPVSPLIRCYKTVTKGMHIETACKQLVKRIEQKCSLIFKESGGNTQSRGNTFLDALQKRLECQKPLSPFSKQRTQKEYIRFYERVFKVLEDLQNSRIIFPDEMEYAVETIKRQVQKSTKSKTDDVSNTRRAFYIIQRALSVYKIIKEDWDEKNPQSPLPRIDWNPPRNRTVALEQVKTLGDRIRQRFCEELYKRSELEPALAKSAVMMMLSLRTAEAAAITAGDVSFIEDEKVGLYAVVKVYSQVKKRKNKVSDLKTPQSVRLITAGYWAATMLQKCFKTIQASERSGIVDPAVLSGWILDVLETVGFNTKDVTPPALNVVDIGDLSAYILRRDAASLMMNVMGLEPYEYSRLIGHTLNESEFKHEDSRHPEEQRKVVQKQSRYIYSTRITNNPSVVPIELKHGDDQKTIDYTEIHFTAPQAASHGLFVFQAREAGESIRIRCLVEAIKVYNRQFETQDRPALGRAEIERSKNDEETTSC